MKMARQYKVILYRLKRQFGSSIVYRKLGTTSLDVKTGVSLSSHTDVPIKLAILLPVGRTINFEHDQAYMGAGRNFTYGATFDLNTRVLIIEARDLGNTVLDTKDQILINGKVCEILKYNLFEPLSSYYVTVKYIENNQ